MPSAEPAAGPLDVSKYPVSPIVSSTLSNGDSGAVCHDGVTSGTGDDIATAVSGKLQAVDKAVYNDASVNHTTRTLFHSLKISQEGVYSLKI